MFSRLRPVHVASMIDSEHDDLPSFVVDAVQHAVRTTTSGEDARKLVAQLTADAVGVLDERGRDELDHGRAHCFRQPFCDRPGGRAGDDHTVGFGHRDVDGRNAFTA